MADKTTRILNRMRPAAQGGKVKPMHLPNYSGVKKYSDERNLFAAASHTHTESDITDLSHTTSLAHTAITGVENGAIVFGWLGGLSRDVGNLFWDFSNSRLGLGNQTPTNTLHVTGTGFITGDFGIGKAPTEMPLEVIGSDITIGTSGSYNAIIGTQDGSNNNEGVLIGYDQGDDVGVISAVSRNVAWRDLIIATGGAERVRFATDGVATFSVQLVVDQTTGAAAQPLQVNADSASGYASAIIDQAGGSGHGLLVKNAPTTAGTHYIADFRADGDSKFYIRDDGKIGAGTNSPGAAFHIKGDVDAGTAFGMRIENTGTGVNRIRYDSGESTRAHIGIEDNNGGALLTGTAGYELVIRSEDELWFGTNGNNVAVKIDTSQNVEIDGVARIGNNTPIYSHVTHTTTGFHIGSATITSLVNQSATVFRAEGGTGDNNYVAVAGATSAAPTLKTQGADTNIDLKLTPKGSGVLQFGTHSSIGAETVTGYITIKDAGGTSRKIAVVS